MLAEQARYVELFGAENGVKWFAEGKSIEDGLSETLASQNETIASLQAEKQELQNKLDSLSVGEAEPIETVPGDESPKKKSLFEATATSRN